MIIIIMILLLHPPPAAAAASGAQPSKQIILPVDPSLTPSLGWCLRVSA
jgi:hypothetical protein